MPSVSLGSTNLGVVAKARSRHPSYLYDLQFKVLAGKLQFWKRMGTFILVKILVAWKGEEGMLPSDLKRGVQLQNLSAQDTLESCFKMFVVASAILWGKQSFKYLVNDFYLYLYF